MGFMLLHGILSTPRGPVAPNHRGLDGCMYKETPNELHTAITVGLPSGIITTLWVLSDPPETLNPGSKAL